MNIPFHLSLSFNFFSFFFCLSRSFIIAWKIEIAYERLRYVIYWLHKKNWPHSSRLFFSCLHSEVGAFALSDSAAICPGPKRTFAENRIKYPYKSKHLLFVVPNTFSGLLFFILVRHHNLLRHLLRLPLGLSSTTAPPWTSTMVVTQVSLMILRRGGLFHQTTPSVILTTTLLFANFFDMSCPFFPLSNCFSICLTKGISASNVSEISV